MVTYICDTCDAYVSQIVGDDDSSVCANLKHSYSELIAHGIWKNKSVDWPRNGSNRYLDDKGKLPLLVRQLDKFFFFFAHRCKSFGCELYKLEKKLGKELKFTKTDCMHLKHNFTYWHQQNRGKTYDEFKGRFPCVIEHHFGEHSFCCEKSKGGWCKYKGNDLLIAKARDDK